jgi:hypothetical protein
MSEHCEVCGPKSEELSGAAGECTTVTLSTTNGFSVRYLLCQEHAETVIHHLGYVIGRLAQPEEEPPNEQSGTEASG